MHMKTIKKVAPVIALMVTVCSGALAQEKDGQRDKNKKTFLNFETPPGLSLDASSEDSKATLGVGKVIGDTYANLSVSGTINDEAGSFASRDGLSVDSSATLSFTKMIMKADKNHPFYLDNRLATLNLIRQKKKAYDDCIATEKTKDANATDTTLQTGACKPQHEDLNKVSWGEDLDQTDIVLKNLHYWTLSFTATDSDFKYTLLDSNTSKKDNEDGYKVGAAYGGIISDEIGSRWEVGLSYEKGFGFESSNKERNICMPVANTDFTECKNIRTAPPLETTHLTPSFTWSQGMKEKSFIKAYEIKISYILEEKVLADDSKEDNKKVRIEAPIYFYQNKDGGAVGGIKFDWLNKVPEDQDKLRVSLFFNKAFDLYK